MVRLFDYKDLEFINSICQCLDRNIEYSFLFVWFITNYRCDVLEYLVITG